MADLPDMGALLNSGLNGLEQYLAWALVEMRRLAIAQGQQRIVRLTTAIEKTTIVISKEKNIIQDYYEGVLKTEVNLSYDSQTALYEGLSFINAIKEISSEQAQLPNYYCSSSRDSRINEKIAEIATGNTSIDTFERLLYWLCLSWQKSNFDLYEVNTNSSFNFIDERPDSGLIQFKLQIPFDYEFGLSHNIVCAAYISPYRKDLFYEFASLGNNQALPTSNSLGNNSKNNNNSTMGN